MSAAAGAGALLSCSQSRPGKGPPSPGPASACGAGSGRCPAGASSKLSKGHAPSEASTDAPPPAAGPWPGWAPALAPRKPPGSCTASEYSGEGSASSPDLTLASSATLPLLRCASPSPGAAAHFCTACHKPPSRPLLLAPAPAPPAEASTSCLRWASCCGPTSPSLRCCMGQRMSLHEPRTSNLHSTQLPSNAWGAAAVLGPDCDADAVESLLDRGVSG